MSATRSTLQPVPMVHLRGVRSVVILLAAALGLCLAGSAGAAVYKCSAASGTPVYQEDPCPPGRELRNFAEDPPPLSIIPGATPRSARSDESAAARPSRRDAPASAGTTERERSAVKRGDPALRRHAHAGMTAGEVLASIGRPDITAGGNRKDGGARWTYLPVPGDEETITTLWVANGTVTAVERKVRKRP